MKFTGIVEKDIIAKGTKSEREALLLYTNNGRYILRRFGGNPFEMDEELSDQIGQMVTVDGDVHGTTLIFKSVE